MANKPEEVKTETAPEVLYAAYIGTADARVLTSEELSKLSITHKDDIRWDSSNGKAVEMSHTNVTALVKALPNEFVVV